GLRVPPALLHDDCHRRLRRATGALVFEALVQQPPLDFGVIREERPVSASHDLLLRLGRNLTITRPLQRLRMKWEAFAVERASRVDPSHLLLEGRRYEVLGRAAKSLGV